VANTKEHKNAVGHRRTRSTKSKIRGNRKKMKFFILMVTSDHYSAVGRLNLIEVMQLQKNEYQFITLGLYTV